MTKYIVSALVVGLVVGAPFAYAEDAGTSTKPVRPAQTFGAGVRDGGALRPALVPPPEVRQHMLEANREWRDKILNASPEDRAELIQAHMEERRAQMEELRADFKARLEERKEAFKDRVGERTTNRYDHVMRLLEAMVARLTGIADRIDTRINELSADGVDTDAAEAELAQARDLIAEAEEAVDALSAAVADALAEDNPREALQSVKPQAEEAKQALRAAHEALREAAQALPRPERSEQNDS